PVARSQMTSARRSCSQQSPVHALERVADRLRVGWRQQKVANADIYRPPYPKLVHHNETGIWLPPEHAGSNGLWCHTAQSGSMRLIDDVKRAVEVTNERGVADAEKARDDVCLLRGTCTNVPTSRREGVQDGQLRHQQRRREPVSQHLVRVAG